MDVPLLADKEKEKWGSPSYEYVERVGSVYPPVSSIAADVSVEEIRSASSFSDYYPPSIHGALISSPEPAPNEQVIVYPGGYGGNTGGRNSQAFGRQLLDEVEIRELLIDHVGHRCCWGSRPARTWKVCAVEDCNVYVGTLETFIEERETMRQIQPYLGGQIDGRHNEPELGTWELDLRSEFPLLFIPHKETRTKIPHSEAVEKCSGCEGRGDVPCPTCNAALEPGFYKEKQMTPCSACHGRGLIAHRDGSDTKCLNCKGEGKLPCLTCGSQGLIKCDTCAGKGSLLTCNTAVVRWRTLSTRKVSASSGAASVPDDVFHRARGVQLCNTQAHQCTPAYFADSFLLNKFSSEVIADRPPVPPTARVICERHTVSVVPVTRVTMTKNNRYFSFYIIGLSRDVYIKDYPSQFCWGLCPCLEWLKLW
ncbi:uncharacterized protein [Aristolochia californica]|uniref:uncharacterized protein n=1 Tax=Aristolochia californica TaxID=171875 RepID=UPI0035DB8D8F